MCFRLVTTFICEKLLVSSLVQAVEFLHVDPTEVGFLLHLCLSTLEIHRAATYFLVRHTNGLRQFGILHNKKMIMKISLHGKVKNGIQKRELL
jgi:hypothetical protein